MWPISADNVGTWLTIAVTAAGLISAWAYTQSAVKRHHKELGLDEEKTLRSRVLLLESENGNLKATVEKNDSAARDRHAELLGELHELGKKLDEIARAAWTAIGRGEAAGDEKDS